jgi:MFS family permease
VLALVGLPRALFILLGGAIVDRHSPQRVLMLSKHANTVLLALLAGLLASGALNLPLLYALALALGWRRPRSRHAGGHRRMLPQRGGAGAAGGGERADDGAAAAVDVRRPAARPVACWR